MSTTCTDGQMTVFATRARLVAGRVEYSDVPVRIHCTKCNGRGCDRSTTLVDKRGNPVTDDGTPYGMMF